MADLNNPVFLQCSASALQVIALGLAARHHPAPPTVPMVHQPVATLALQTPVSPTASVGAIQIARFLAIAASLLVTVV